MAAPASTPHLDRFIALQAEFETATTRLAGTKDLAEKRRLLRELRQILAELDDLVAEN